MYVLTIERVDIVVSKILYWSLTEGYVHGTTTHVYLEGKAQPLQLKGNYRKELTLAVESFHNLCIYPPKEVQPSISKQANPTKLGDG
jgi:hypothetical protein